MPVINMQKLTGDFELAIVISRFHGDITQKLLDGAQERLAELDFPKENITLRSYRQICSGYLFWRSYFW
jgi:6,7-dimethyl-8-ribityllumazine synthase